MIREHGKKDPVTTKTAFVSGCFGILLPIVGFGQFSVAGMGIGAAFAIAAAWLFTGSGRKLATVLCLVCATLATVRTMARSESWNSSANNARVAIRTGENPTVRGVVTNRRDSGFDVEADEIGGRKTSFPFPLRISGTADGISEGARVSVAGLNAATRGLSGRVWDVPSFGASEIRLEERPSGIFHAVRAWLGQGIDSLYPRKEA